jgi:hypothetical protein
VRKKKRERGLGERKEAEDREATRLEPRKKGSGR